MKTIVTISHLSTDIVVERARLAKAENSTMVMIMPPFFGTMKGNQDQIFKVPRRLD